MKSLHLSPQAILQISLVSIFLASSPVSAQVGSVDTGFNAGLTAGSIFNSALQPDGKWIIGGDFGPIVNFPERIARLNVDGILDAGFNAGVNGTIFAIAVQTDGKIVVVGSFTAVNGTPRSHVARLNGDGTLDETFDPAANGGVEALAIQPDGRILIGGYFTQVGGAAHDGIARLNADGTADAGFTASAPGTTALVLTESGRIVAGKFNVVMRFLASGSIDPVFTSASVDGMISALGIAVDGKTLVAGSFGLVNGTARNNMARLNGNGSLDTAFNPNITGGSGPTVVRTLAIQADEGILIGGDFTLVGGTTRNRIARLYSNGMLDSTFNPNASGPVECICQQSDGKVLAGGAFSSIGGGSRVGIARLNNGTAAQTFSKITATSFSWQRSGTVPGTVETTFDVSADGGYSWTRFGQGSRVGVSASWSFSSASLPAVGWMKARARLIGGRSAGGSGLIEQVLPFAPDLPTPVLATNPVTGSYTTGDAVRAVAFTPDAVYRLTSLYFPMVGGPPGAPVTTYTVEIYSGASSPSTLVAAVASGSVDAFITAGNFTVTPTVFIVPGTKYWIVIKGVFFGGGGLFMPVNSNAVSGPHVSYHGYYSGPTTGTLFLNSTNLSFTINGESRPRETWRQMHFGTIADTGTAADGGDFDADSETNLLEFATGQNPKAHSRAVTQAALVGGNIEFTYTRAVAAVTAGVGTVVQWSDSLAGAAWSSDGVIETIVSDNGTLQQVKATLPAGTLGSRFVRLRVF